MQKNSLIFLLSTLVVGIFGAFFRWLEVLNAFDAATGLYKPASITGMIVVIYCILAVIAMIGFCVVYLHAYRSSVESPEAAMRARNGLPKVIAWAFSALIIIGAIATMLTSNYHELPGFRRIFAAMAIFAGIAFPFTVSRKDGTFSPVAETASLVPPLFGCLWLVFSYKLNAENPVLRVYAFEILAIAALTYGYYNICSYFYGRAKRPGKILFSLLLAAFFCIVCLADQRPFAMQLMFIAGAGMMLLYGCMIFANLQIKGVYPEKRK